MKMAYKFTIATVSSVLLFHHFYAQLPCKWPEFPHGNGCRGLILRGTRSLNQRFNQQCLHVSSNIDAVPCISALSSPAWTCLDPLNKVTEHLRHKNFWWFNLLRLQEI